MPETSPEIAEELELTELASQNFRRWNESLQTHNSEEVALLYAAEASFLPTLDEKLRQGPAKTAQYFEHFLEKNPAGEIIEQAIQPLGPDIYLHSGLYNFEVDSADHTKREIVEARFTFVWQKNGQGEWKIIHHHSSLRPNND